MENETKNAPTEHAVPLPVPPPVSISDYNDDSFYSNETIPFHGDDDHNNGPYANNLRLFLGNGVKVLQASPDNSLAVVLITFPDPFPNHPPHRLLQYSVLDEIVRVLQPAGGRLVVATDHDGHATWVQSQMEQHHNHAWKKIAVGVVVPSVPPPSTEATNQTQQHTHDADDDDHHDTVLARLRSLYLPAISKYEMKGWREGRTTKLLIYEKTGWKG
jgi:hypothetical protein